MRYLRYHLGYIIDSPNYIAKKKPKRKCKFFQINKNIEMKKRQYFQICMNNNICEDIGLTEKIILIYFKYLTTIAVEMVVLIIIY